MRTLRRSADLWIGHPASDYALSVAVAACVALTGTGEHVGEANRGAFYQTLASVGGVLLSLGSIVITLLFTVTPNDRLDLVLRHVGHALRRLVVSSLTGLLLATAGFALLFLMETSSATSRLFATCALLVFATARFARLWWLLGKVLAVLSSRPEPPRDEEPWRAPDIRPGDYKLPSRHLTE